MKKLLLGFMLLLVVTPSLACAMPVCSNKAGATQSGHPCADHASDHHGDESQSNGKKAGLLADCMGVDFQKATATNIDKPDLKTDFIVYALIDEVLTDQFLYNDKIHIRGPPPDWPDHSQTQPSILLTTLRFRI
jgi:hypothetical protein